MQPQPYTFRMPHLDLGATPVHVSVWHAKLGQFVEFRQRLVEVTAGAVLVDLPCPASGFLAECCVAEDEPVSSGQILAIIHAAGDEAL